MLILVPTNDLLHVFSDQWFEDSRCGGDGGCDGEDGSHGSGGALDDAMVVEVRRESP
jgi:hypothetical protein